MSLGVPGMVFAGGLPLAVLQALENAKRGKAGPETVAGGERSLLAPMQPGVRPGYQDTPVLAVAPEEQGLLQEHPLLSLGTLAAGLSLAGFGAGNEGGVDAAAAAKGAGMPAGAGAGFEGVNAGPVLDVSQLGPLGGPNGSLAMESARAGARGTQGAAEVPLEASAGAAAAAAPAAAGMSMGGVAGLGLAGAAISGAGAAAGSAMEAKAQKDIAKRDREFQREMAGYEGVRDFAGYLAQKTDRLRSIYAGLGMRGS